MVPILLLPKLRFDRFADNPDIALGQEMRLTGKTLATALSSRCSLRSIKNYIQRFPIGEVSKTLKQMVKGHRVITYAVDTDNVELVQLLLEYNVDVNIDAHESGNIPLLAFTIMRAGQTGFSNTEMVTILLAQGANPKAIPMIMWQEYLRAPCISTASTQSIPAAEAWCKPFHREVLAITLNLTVRYLLWRASRLSPPKLRVLQIAAGNKMTRLLKLPLLMVGQESTTRMVMDTVQAHIACNTSKPLVLAFAGPSGHGKTELVKQMGTMLSVPMIELDCTHVGNDMALFGSTYGYIGNEGGSPLNSFLAGNAGQRCVVFLDEFEKTSPDVHNSLLKVMDNGSYRDRRQGRDHGELDCKKVIWVLATNLGAEKIQNFHTLKLAPHKDEEVQKLSMKPLQDDMARTFTLRFSPAVAGRIDIIAPFFPFSPGEQAVVAHKFLLSLQRDLRQPIDMEEPRCNYVGHVDLRIMEDGKICKSLAKDGYRKEEGARSVEKVVRDVRRKVYVAYSSTDELVTEETNKGPMSRFDLQLHPISETEEELSVFDERVGRE